VKRRPPYSKLLDERANRNTWWILCGSDSWDTAKDWSEDDCHWPFTLCPPGEDPHQFDWTRYRDAPDPVALLRCGAVDGEQLRQLSIAMLNAGSTQIYDPAARVRYGRKQ